MRMTRKRRSLIAKVIAAILAVTLIITLLVPLVSNAAETKRSGAAYDTKYTDQIAMTYLVQPMLLKNTDAVGVATQLTQMLHYQTMTQWEIWDLYRNGYNIPLQSIKILVQNGEISNVVYKLAAGEELSPEDVEDVYDADYYKTNNAGIAAAVADGTIPDNQILFLNFIRSGMDLGLKGNEEFNLEYYKANYPDLVKNIGDDNFEYYIHYILTGKQSGRVADRLLK